MRTSLLTGITSGQLRAMMTCFDAIERSFLPGETILTCGKPRSTVGILTQGAAELVRIDADGCRTIVDRFEASGVFSDAFLAADDLDDYSVFCTAPAVVLLFGYTHLVTPCAKVCPHHSQLISNLLRLTAQQAAKLHEHIDVLSRRNMRDKLMAYFAIQSRRAGGSRQFTLPISLTDLADYLCVDRSAMMRELKKMREDGLVTAKATNITLL